jgi:hypothetical protein
MPADPLHELLDRPIRTAMYEEYEVIVLLTAGVEQARPLRDPVDDARSMGGGSSGLPEVREFGYFSSMAGKV